MAQGDGTVIHGVRVPLVLPVLGERRNKPSQRRRRGRPSPHRREQDGGCLSARQSPREAARDDGRMGRLLRRQNVMSRYTRAWRHLLRQYELHVDRIDEEDRAIFLGPTVEELSYRPVAGRQRLDVVDNEEER